MSDENEVKIKNFDELYDKKRNIQPNEDEFSKELKYRYFGSVGFYIIFGQFVIGIILAIILSSIDSNFSYWASDNEKIFYEVSNNSEYVSVVNEDIFYQYIEDYNVTVGARVIVGTNNYFIFNNFSEFTINEYINSSQLSFSAAAQFFQETPLTLNGTTFKVISSAHNVATSTFSPLTQLGNSNIRLVDKMNINITSPTNQALFMGLNYLVLLISLILILKPVIKIDYKKTLTKGLNVFILKSLVCLGVMIAATVVVSQITNLVAQQIGYHGNSNNQLSIEQMFTTSNMWILLITVVLVGPIVEELVFRKALHGIIRGKWQKIAISSVVFALIHLIPEMLALNIQGVLFNLPGYLVPGMMFGYFYERYDRNVFIPITAHVMLNLISALQILA